VNVAKGPAIIEIASRSLSSGGATPRPAALHDPSNGRDAPKQSRREARSGSYRFGPDHRTGAPCRSLRLNAIDQILHPSRRFIGEGGVVGCNLRLIASDGGGLTAFVEPKHVPASHEVKSSPPLAKTGA
jgi:hypothetical protein